MVAATDPPGATSTGPAASGSAPTPPAVEAGDGPGAARFRGLIKPLLALLAVTLLGFAFVHLASEVVEGDTRGFDTALLQAAQAFRQRHPWVTSVMRDLSGLGSAAVLSLFTLATAGYLLLLSARRTAVIVALSAISGTLANSLLKSVFDRSRPPRDFADHVLPSLSFPSGHASMSALVFLTLGALFATTRVAYRERIYIVSTAAVLAGLVGLSRVMLGVHWATDVLGGWAFGAGWAMIWLLLARRFARDDPVRRKWN